MRRILLTALVPTLLVGSAAVEPVPAQTPRGEELPVRRIELENGMRVLVLPRTTAPTVALVVQYAVGGVNEHLGITGIAHVLEHLLFKGTTTLGTTDLAAEERLFAEMDAAHASILAERGSRRPDRERIERLSARIDSLEDRAARYVESNAFDRILTRNGARGLNATTGSEATTYYVELPANRLELWFVLEADRMRNPVFREFYAERDVVMEERRMRLDTSPGGRLYQALLATAFRVHPYGVPVVGHMSDLESLGRGQVASYYQRYYGAANAVVTVVGDVDPDRVESLARRYFGPVRRGSPTPPVLAREPEQRGARRTEVAFDAEPAVRIGWHTVDVFHEDMPALAMLASILTGGRTSRLHRRLVLEDRIATSVSATMGPGERFPQLFQIGAVPRSPHAPAEVEEAIYRELDRLAATPPDPRELERVRNQIEAGAVRRLGSNLGLAFELAGSESLFGDWREAFRLGRRVAEVTPARVREVAGRYFREENRSVATLVRPDGDETAAGARR